MRRVTTTLIVLCILSFAVNLIAQQTATNSSPRPPCTPLTGGPGTLDTVGIWGSTGCDLIDTPISGTATVQGNLNLPSNANAYQIGGTPVLSIPLANDLVIGVGAGASIAGEQDTFVGTNAGQSTTSGSFNTFVGLESGLSNVTGGWNAYYGYQAGFFTTGSYNTYIGTTSGSHVAIGSNNTALGFAAGSGGTTWSVSNGSNNTSVGYEAGLLNAANNTTFVGYQAGQSNTSASGNTFVGYQAGQSNTTAQGNTFIGYGAGTLNVTGKDNTFLGHLAGPLNNPDGSDNIFIGFVAGQDLGGGNNNIYLGHKGVPSESNTIRIGGDNGQGYGTQTAAYIAGDTATVVGSQACVVTSGPTVTQIGVCTSSGRFKEQIRDMGESSNKLFQLRPVSFLYKAEYDKGTRTLQYGLIAEEVAEVYPEMVGYDKDGLPYTVKYQVLAPMLLNELQKQHSVIAAQGNVIKSQQEQIHTQAQQLSDLQQRLSRLESLMAK